MTLALLKSVLITSVSSAIVSLHSTHNEHFYYYALVMAELFPPYISAWSYEALNRHISDHISIEDYYYFKWSSVESPYCGYGYDLYFKEVCELFDSDFNLSYDENRLNYNYSKWIDAMESVMSELDEKVLFLNRLVRDNVFINVETIPDDSSNMLRGKRLNPHDSYEKWYNEVSACYHQNEESLKINWDEIWNPTLCNVILLKPIYTKSLIMRLKKLINYEGGITNLILLCQKCPSTIMSKCNYKQMKEQLENDSELSSYIYLEMLP